MAHICDKFRSDFIKIDTRRDIIHANKTMIIWKRSKFHNIFVLDIIITKVGKRARLTKFHNIVNMLD